jgi:ADP-ribose pyrophosphatase YjhB (NUDIX family)
VNEKNEILVSKRAIEPKKGTYDCPGGFIGLDETAEEALKRELKEELGLDLEVEPENYVGSFYVDYEYQGINYDVLIFHFAVYVNSTITDLIKPQDDVESVEFIDHKKAEEILGWHGDIKAIKKFFNL